MIKAADGTMKFENTDVIPNLTNMLKDCEIIQVYSGKDHYCRCGCGGKYYEMKFEKERAGIKRNINRANKFLHKHPHECELYIGSDESYLNIPTVIQGEGSDPAGRAITIYFKGEIHI